MGLFHGGSWEGSIYGPLSEPNGIMVSHNMAACTLPQGVLSVFSIKNKGQKQVSEQSR